MAVLETVNVNVGNAGGCHGVNTCAIQRLDADGGFTFVHPATGVVTPVSTLAALIVLLQNIWDGRAPSTSLPL